jgi:hypothetical protein
VEKIPTLAYNRYSAGYSYNLRLNYYNKITENENMVNGEQWVGVNAGDLPTPVFNLEKRIMDYKIASIMSQKVRGVYSVEGVSEYDLSKLDEITPEIEKELQLSEVAKLMTGNAEIMWERLKMDSLLREALRDGFTTGDMCCYTYWDPNIRTGQKSKGDFVSELAFGGNVFFGNPNERNIQKQPYVVVLIRDTVENLKEEARANGRSEEEIELITGDDDTDAQAGKYGKQELESTDELTKKTNAFLMFYKKDGKVMWSKSTKFVTIKEDIDLGISRYPIAWANWDIVRNSYHGKAECSEIHPNQRFINKMFAMCMIWFMYNAFGKIAYDATRISSWTNEIGVAIPVQGQVDGVVQQLASGDFNNAVLLVIDYAIKYTKDFLGATDAALGEVRADNTSAIIMVQKASAIPLENIQKRLYQFVEDILLIWAEFMVNKYAEGRKVPVKEDGRVVYKPFTHVDKERMIMNVQIEVGASSYWNETLSQQSLDKLLDRDKITLIQWLERTMPGMIPKKQELIDELKAIAESTPDETEQAESSPQYEAMAQFFESLPPDIQDKLQALPPEQMENQLMAMMQQQVILT